MGEAAEGFDSWCVLELMGHVRLAGRVTEEERFGGKLGRIDCPQPDDSFVTVYFGGGSVYRMTPCSEAAARAVAARNRPEPVHRYELPAPTIAPAYAPIDRAGDDDEDDEIEDLDFGEDDR